MAKQQRDAIDAALRAEPFGLNQSTDEHRKSFDAFALRPYPADVVAADVTLGGVGAIELTVAGHAVEDGLAAYAGLLESGISPAPPTRRAIIRYALPPAKDRAC